MEEVLEIKQLLLKGDTALLLLDELEEMSHDDKFANICSYTVVLLYYLVMKVEQRTTKLWEVSIRNCVLIIPKKTSAGKQKDITYPKTIYIRF